MAENIRQITEAGQSLWYDNIRRGMLDSGEMQSLIDEGIRGVTSNPSIFHKAICGSTDYESSLKEYAGEKLSADEIYEKLVLADIARTADLFRPVYDQTNGVDGYVSIEVEPNLADDTEATIARARDLFGKLNRPNIMIKVPATDAGMPAIRTLISEGINVNVTLIFSVKVYEQVLEAWLTGLEDRLDTGADISRVASVASFFVSRVDSSVDKQLQTRIENGDTQLKSLMGTAAVANAKIAYELYKKKSAEARFDNVRNKGAMPQRPLWASTSTKNPEYRDTLYVDTLIGPETVNTVPPNTLDAIRTMNTPSITLAENIDQAKEQLQKIEEAGISMDQVTETLRTEGVKAFVDAFDALMEDIRKRIA